MEKKLNILEAFSLDDFDNYDFIDVFLTLFKEWLLKRIGDSVKKQPLSYLFKKYGKRFLMDYNLTRQGDEDEDEYMTMNQYSFIKWGKELVRRGVLQMPSMYQEEKFTERFKAPLEFFMNNLEIPSYLKIGIKEDSPYKLKLTFDVDFPEMIKSPGSERTNRGKYSSELRKYINNFLGVDFGNPSHGELELEVEPIVFRGFEDWSKTVFNKEVKPKIKQLPSGKGVHSISLKVEEDGRINLKMNMKSHTGWSIRNSLRPEVKQLLEDLGYSTQRINIEI